ncbi:hypothetical protein ACSUZJ_22540 [Telluria sp. B2]
MRNLHLEAAIWNLFTSTEFYEAAAQECDETLKWFSNLAISKHVVNFGRNNQIADMFKTLARDFRRGAELAKLGDYELIWNTARSVSGDVRGIMEQPLHSWMGEVEYREFSGVRIGRVLAYAGLIENALNNAMVKGKNFFDTNPASRGRRDDDDGFPGEDIVSWYNSYLSWNKGPLFSKLPDLLPEYLIDQSVECKTGEEVPWTGVWYPGTGLEKHSLTFAIKGLRMQPVFRITKTKAELKAEGVMFPYPETVAVATTWHPVVPCGRRPEPDRELWAKAGQPCPKAGIWQPTDPGAAQRLYEAGEPMLDLKSAYGYTVWRWVSDR